MINSQFQIYNVIIVDATYRANGKKCLTTIGRERLPVFLPTCNGLAKNGPYTQAIYEQLLFSIPDLCLEDKLFTNSTILLLKRLQAQIEAGLLDKYISSALV